MGELQRVSTQRSALAPAARAPEREQRARLDRRETAAVPLRRMMAAGTLQPRLAVGAADDPFEREAERAADTVMAPGGAPKSSADGIRRAGVAASLMRVVRRAFDKTDGPNKKDDDDKKKKLVQKESAGPGPSVVPAGMESSIATMSAGGAGTPLSSSLRSQFEPRFGYDFGGVRTHTGAEAAGAATALGARAFTVGDHIFFGAGEYQPASVQGQRLIAHELTHVVQQSGADRNGAPHNENRAGSAISQPVAEGRTVARSVQRQIADVPSRPARASGRPIITWEVAGLRLYKTLSGKIIELPSDMTAEQVAQLEDEAIAAEKRLEKLPPPKPVPDVRKPAPKPARTVPPKPRARGRRGVGKAPPKLAEAAAALLKAVGGGKVAQYLAAKGAPVFTRGAAKLSRLKLNEQTHDDGGEKLRKSEEAVVIPESEGQSKGNAGQVSVVGDRSVPVVDESKGKLQLEQSLDANVPRTIAAVDNFKRDKKAQHTGADVTEVVQGDKNAVIGTFGDLRLTPTPVLSTHQAVDLPPVEKAPPTPAMNLGRGAIAPLQKEHTDVSAYTKEADGKLKAEGVTQEQLDMVDSGELAEANKEKKGMAQRAATEPLAVQKLAQQEAERVDNELVQEEKAERSTLEGRRKAALEATAQKQKGTKSAFEKKREQVATEINNRYKTAQDLVTTKLADLETQSMKRFDDGNAAAARDFEDNVHRELEVYKDDRYSGWFGWARKAKDWWLGMDELDGVKKIFHRNREAFVKRIDTLVEDIAAENKRVIQQCTEELATARKGIQEFVDGLEPGLRDIGKKAAGEMDDRLNDLDMLIVKKEEELQNKLKDKQTAAIKAIDEKIEKMKEAMSGALAKLGRLLLWAAKKFFTWALEKFGFSLSTIENIINKGTAVLKAIFTGPIQFVKNLIAAAKMGFTNFAKNFLTHLKDAVFEWLTGALQGVTLPGSWSLKGILSVLFQVVGLTWVNIKSRLVLLIPAPVVETLETTFGLVRTLIVEGPMAAWEEIKDIGEDLRKGFVDAVTNWIKWKVVEEAVKTVLALFIPGAGIVRAVIAIYDTIVFFIQKAKDIIQMIGNFLGSIAEIAAGNIGAAAAALENGLARGLKLVIVFLARFLRLGGITARIRVALDTVRGKVNAVIDKVAKWVVNMAKKAGKIAGKGEKQAKKDEDPKWGIGVAGVHGDVTSMKSQGKATAKDIEAAILGWKTKFGFSALRVETAGTKWAVKGSMSPEKEIDKGDEELPPALADVHEGIRFHFPNVKDDYAKVGKAKGPPIKVGSQWLIEYWANKRKRGKNSPVLFKTPAFKGTGTDEKDKAYNVAGVPGAVATRITKSMAGSKTLSVHGSPLWTTPYDPAVGLPHGWDRLDASEWFRAHLINGSMGGPGAAWNLVPTPVAVNNAMAGQHEKVLRDGLAMLTPADNASYWKKLTVTWRGDGDSTPTAGKSSDFAASISAEYGDTLRDIYGKWSEQEATASNSYPIRMPLEPELLPGRRLK